MTSKFRLYFPIFPALEYLSVLPKDLRSMIEHYFPEDQVYRLLHAINPCLPYSQWTYNQYSPEYQRMRTRLIHPSRHYTKECSAVMKMTLINKFSSADNSIECYDIYFSCYDYQIVTSSKRHLGPKDIPGNPEPWYVFPRFITNLHDGLEYCDCSQSRHHIDCDEYENWCVSCRGETTTMSKLMKYFYSRISFNNIPIDHIIVLNKRVEKINDSNRKEVDLWLEEHRKQAKACKSYLDNYEKTLAEKIRLMEEERLRSLKMIEEIYQKTGIHV